MTDVCKAVRLLYHVIAARLNRVYMRLTRFLQHPVLTLSRIEAKNTIKCLHVVNLLYETAKYQLKRPENINYSPELQNIDGASSVVAQQRNLSHRVTKDS